MQIGIFADIHDHLDNARAAVDEFNRRGCGLVIFAGDFVSTFTIPVLRGLNCPLLGCFGDNEGNKLGLTGGLRIVGQVGEPPLGFRTAEGLKFLVTHQYELLRGDLDGANVVVFGHTHKPSVVRDGDDRLLINPGETSGWTYRRPTVAVLDTATMSVEIVELPGMPAAPPRQINRSSKAR
ncbi:MAG: metallophosphoesterase [Planctomycetes bacterium]|nr:metallophosphoesterase [Planctomycetota bacterium]